MKRKAESGTSVPKDKKKKKFEKPSKEGRETKAPKTTVPAAESSTPNVEKKPVQKSVLQLEEKSFPRGGASVLTPLEHKQIQVKATQDVLFEQSGSKRPVRHDSSDDDFDQPAEEATEKRPSKKQRKSTAEKKGKANGVVEKQERRIEGLGYKRLVPGTIVLGQVTQITSRDVALALPNNLSGFVALTDVSDQLNQRVEKLLQEGPEGENEEEEEDAEFEDVDLKKSFHVGQYLRAYVKSSGVESSSSNKKRIELSLNPKLANRELTNAEMLPNCMVQASVASVEDHGLIMDLGLDEAGIKGFMSSKETGGMPLNEVEEGAVFLCLILGSSPDGRIIKLSADHKKAGNLKKSHFLVDTPSISSFLPGTAVEILVTEAGDTGLRGKIMGMLDVTADSVHSGAVKQKDLSKKYAPGSKTKVRILFAYPKGNDDEQRLAVSALDHILTLSAPSLVGKESTPLQKVPLSSTVQEAKVVKVSPKNGLYLDIGAAPVLAFAHIARISDEKIESLSETSGTYKLGSKHRVRVIGFNPIDGVFLVSLQQKTLEQPFLRIEDITVGQVVNGRVERIILNEKGVGGLLVNLAEGITGLVPETHMADVHLQHPERKFREGMAVKARILSTDPERRLIRLTLKKSLVNTDIEPWVSYDNIKVGERSPGTLINVLPNGAVVQFYGKIRAFLPASEMSEAYVQDPRQHFHVGQVVNVRVLSIDPEENKMLVSCKDPSSFGPDQLRAWEKLTVGSIVQAKVIETSPTNITLELDSGTKGLLPVTHLSDGTSKQARSLQRSLRVDQRMTDLVVIDKKDKRHIVMLSSKPSILKAAKAQTIISSFQSLRQGAEFPGWVRGITADAIFVEFPGNVVGILHSSNLTDDMKLKPDFGVVQGQSISPRVLSVDPVSEKLSLSLREAAPPSKPKQNGTSVTNAVDGTSESVADFAIGKLTKARITGVKATQLNVTLADDVQGRVDASEVFSDWQDIKDRKKPLANFGAKQIIDVRVIGVHDVKNHTFLPISHRSTHCVFELSARSLDSENTGYVLTIDKIKSGHAYIGIINNISDGFVWVNLSPSVRGRVSFMDLTNDVSLLQNIDQNFPIGSALKLHVKAVDPASNRLDLISKEPGSTKGSDPEISKGITVPGRVTKVTDRGVSVQLSESQAGFIPLTELTDDYDQAKPGKFKKNDIIRVRIAEIDIPNKLVLLSARPSQVLSSSMAVKDPQVASLAQLKLDQILRGFIKHVGDQGLFVAVGPNVTAFVRVRDLSDAFIKDWKASFSVDQLVQGRVIELDAASNKLRLSLKDSALSDGYSAPITFENLQPRQIVSGRVVKVEKYGVFVSIDNSDRVSGLCHKSEIADGKVEDVAKLYEVNDKVKAIVLKLDKDKRRVNFGLKASYFSDVAAEVEDDSDVEVDEAFEENEADESSDDGGLDLEAVKDMDDDVSGENAGFEADDMELDGRSRAKNGSIGLQTSGFDWSGGLNDQGELEDISDTDVKLEKRKKKRKPEIQVDMTGDMDKNGPRAVADFERLLLGQPNSSSTWIQYMAFQLGLGEVDKARAIADRALKMINMREEDEKLNIWIAYLNLENTYGSEETVEEVFKQACNHNDKQEVHERLLSILIESGKHDVSKAVSLNQPNC
jgi:rRNA biogenesis protein RRP5